MRDGVTNPLEEYRRINVEGTKAVALAAVEQGVSRMVFVSTVKVNGESTSRKSFSEDDPPNPQDPYAVSKWETEEMLRSIAARTGLEVVIVRPPLVYGPGVRANFLHLMRLVRRGLPLPLPETNNRRSLVGIENLADCLVCCVMHPEAANQTFMVSDGQDVSTHELVVQLARFLKRPARFLPIPEVALRFAARLVGKQSVIDRLLGSLEIDSRKVRHTLGWTPSVTLGHGLEATTRWYLESLRPLP
jgi:UDP-glucose 4-epimerase